MDNTIIQQGTFTSTGANMPIALRSDVDWMHVINWTQSLANTINTGVEFWWQRGMPQYDGLCYYHVAADHTLSSNACASLGNFGFQLYDSSLQTFGPNVPITRIPANGVVLTANTAGLFIGSIVRFNNVVLGLQHCNKMYYTVTAVNPGVSFTIVPAANNVDTGVTTGNYQLVLNSDLFKPGNRNITAISIAPNAQVTTSIPHLMTVGQEVRFHIPRVTNLAYGMLPLDGQIGIVTAIVDAWNYRVNIDTTGYPIFAFPLTADVPFTYAQMEPFGEDTATALTAGVDLLADATINIGEIGIVLFAGAYGPAGQQGDVIRWVAGKSFNV